MFLSEATTAQLSAGLWLFPSLPFPLLQNLLQSTESLWHLGDGKRLIFKIAFYTSMALLDGVLSTKGTIIFLRAATSSLGRFFPVEWGICISSAALSLTVLYLKCGRRQKHSKAYEMQHVTTYYAHCYLPWTYINTHILPPYAHYFLSQNRNKVILPRLPRCH